MASSFQNYRPPPGSDLAMRLNLRRAGHREWRGDCPACGYHDSFVMTQRQDRPLLWCASCQDRDAMTQLLRGVAPAVPARPPTPCLDDAQRKMRALSLWDGAAPAVGTPADQYLTAVRGLPGLAASPVLRFRTDMPHPAGGRLPALVAIVTDVNDKPVAIHRTYLRHDGTAKADMEPQKATLGPMQGGAIRLDPVAPELIIGEGIETSASAGRVIGLPAWAAGSAGNLARGLVLPPEVRSVAIAVDADAAGERAAREAAFRWSREGRHVRIARPDQAGWDFNDLLCARAAAEAAHA
jgi:hypothetical protein